MAKFNEVQKKRRALIADQKRAVHGDPITGKLKNNKKSQAIAISGKRKRKLLKKWRRDQKEAVEKGLLTMQDVEMAVAGEEGSSKDAERTAAKFHVKKGLKLKRLKHNGKQKRKSKAATVDAMVE